MNKRFLPPLAVAIFMLASSVAGFAQTTSVQGVVKDQSGHGIQGVQVVWHNTENNREYKFKTNKKGEYQAIGVMVGKYNIIVSIDGKEATRKDNFDLKSSGDSLNLPSYDFIISPASQGSGSGATPGATPAAATPTQAPPTEEELKKMKLSKEQQEKIKEIEEQNKKVEEENKKIGDVNTLMNQARDLMRATPPDYEKALSIAQQATQVGGTYDLTWGVLGEAEFKNKHYQEAADAYQKAIQMNAASAKPNLQIQGLWNHDLGRALIRLQKIPEGQAAFEAAAKEQPTSASKEYYTEGAELLNGGHIDEAIAAFDKAITADPSNAEAYFQKGITMMNKATMQGNKLVAPPGTEEALQKYLELAPTGPNAGNATEVLQTLGAKVKTTYKK